MGKRINIFWASLVSIMIVLMFFFVYTVSPGEQAVITQFGKVIKSVDGGIHYRIPLIQKVHILPKHLVLYLATSPVPIKINGSEVMFPARSLRYQVGDPLKYFEKFGVSMEVSEVISQALKMSLDELSKQDGFFQVDESQVGSGTQSVKLDEPVKDKILEEVNKLLEPKGIVAIRLAPPKDSAEMAMD